MKISFAPDNTKITKYESSLFESFRGLMNPAKLENTLLRAFQSWTMNTNLNVGIVEDSGAAFGESALTQGDQRFGDIRVAAIPLAADVNAFAIKHDELVSGSWAGEIIFNSNAKFKDVDEFYRLALHEAGHVLGLEHNHRSDSVMNPESGLDVLSSFDRSEIRKIYGIRHGDHHDLEEANDNLEQATGIENSGRLKGEIPLVMFGDLSHRRDKDFYELEGLSNYSGPISFRLLTEGISSAATRLTIYNEDGRRLKQRAATSIRGSEIVLTLPRVREDEDYFVSVSSAKPGKFAIGSYVLVATFDNKVKYSKAEIDRVALGDYSFADQDEIESLFVEGTKTFYDFDRKVNDSFASAVELDTAPGFTEQSRYVHEASLSSFADKDFYKVKSAESEESTGVMTVIVNALEHKGLVPNIRVFDKNRKPLKTDFLTNGNGETVLQVDNITAESDYFILIRPDLRNDRFDTGNYRLQIEFDRNKREYFDLGKGTISNGRKRTNHTLYVAETQMFHFLLDTTENSYDRNALLWMTIYNESGKVVFRTATKKGQARSAQSVILRPGRYLTRITSATQGGKAIPSMSYKIKGVGVSDPQGPELVDPSEQPFKKCDPRTNEYCYPHNIRTDDPFVFVNGKFVPTSPNTPNPPYVDPNAWYWYTDWLTDEVPTNL